MIPSQLCDRLFEFNKQIYDLIDNTILPGKRYVGEPNKLYFTVLNKTNNALFTIISLLNEDKFDRRFLDSIFITIRSCLSDALTIDFIISSIRKNPGSENEIIMGLYTDHIKKALDNVKLYIKLYNKPSSVYDEKKNELIKIRPEFFKENGSYKYKVIHSNPTNAVNEIIANRKINESIEIISDAFELWDVFSKYEHLGYLSYFMTNRQFMEENDPELRMQLILSMRIIVSILKFLSYHWVNGDSPKYIQIEKIYAEIMKIQ